MTSRLTATLSGTQTVQYLQALRARGWLGGGASSQQAGRADAAHTSLGRPHLGAYHLLEKLGSGGMGEVYKAEHRLMRRPVAVKLLAPDLVHDAAAVARFHREVQAAARLTHPYIVTAFDAAEADGQHFLVMEFVEGVDLGRVIAEAGPMPLPLACVCMYQVCLGLQHAHERGLVHYDIKPSNLLLTRGEGSGVAVKILDFGLARLTGPHAPPEGCRSPNLSGTPDFMAPEQAQDNHATDARSDLYSLGCTFYYLLAGQVPFPGGNWSEKLLRHQFDPAEPLERLRSDLPPEIPALIRRLMAKRPEDRYPSAAAVAELLEVWLEERSPRSTPTPSTTLEICSSTPPEDMVPATVPENVTATVAPCTFSSGELELPPLCPVVSAPRGRGGSLAWSPVFVGLMAAGVATAWLAREGAWLASARTEVPLHAPVRAGAAEFAVSSLPGRALRNLDEAVQAARDGDTVTISANGPFDLTSLRLVGKQLTVQAGPGYRPAFRWRRPAGQPDWQPWIQTDRPLCLIGLELLADLESLDFLGRPTHLVYAEGGAVCLQRCRLVAERGTALIVCRESREVLLHDTQLLAYNGAVVVDLPILGADLELSGNDLRVASPDGSALTLWQRGPTGPGPVHLHLRRNRVEAGRIITAVGLPARLDIVAESNDLTFRQALLNLTACSSPTDWKERTGWQGRDNRFHPGSGWLRLDDQPVPCADLNDWRRLVGPETGSVP